MTILRDLIALIPAKMLPVIPLALICLSMGIAFLFWVTRKGSPLADGVAQTFQGEDGRTSMAKVIAAYFAMLIGFMLLRGAIVAVYIPQDQLDSSYWFILGLLGLNPISRLATSIATKIPSKVEVTNKDDNPIPTKEER